MIDTCVLNEQFLCHVLQALLMEAYFHGQLHCLIGVSGALEERVNTDYGESSLKMTCSPGSWRCALDFSLSVIRLRNNTRQSSVYFELTHKHTWISRLDISDGRMISCVDSLGVGTGILALVST